MFKAIRTAICNYTSRRKAENYRRGYDYGAGALVRHEETPSSLAAKIWHDDKDEFDRGMMDAAQELVRRGIVDDDPPPARSEPILVPMARRQGFDHALGALLRGEGTPSSLEALLLAAPKGDFEAGVLDAIERATALRIVANTEAGA